MTLPNLIEQIKIFEGFRSNTYLDSAGVKTIGYGFVDKDLVNKGTISRSKANNILTTKVVTVYEKVCIKMDAYGYHNMTANQLYALTDFAYNLGLGAIDQLTNKGKRSLTEIGNKIPDYNKCRINGKLTPLSGLTKRRNYEKSIYFSKN